MRTISFKSLLHSVSLRAGISPDSGDYTDEHAASVADFAEIRIQEGWEWMFWPEWTVIERRQYRYTWDNTETYALGAEVYYNDNYYYSLQAANTGKNPESEASWWVLVAAVDDDDYAFDRYVSLDQTDETAIGEVKGVYARNPRTSDYPGALAFHLTDNGVQPSSLAPNRVWIEFRKRPPEFTSVEWVAATAYVTGDVVYVDSTGQCYKALQDGTGKDPTTETAYWEVQPVPFVLNKFLKRAVYSDLLAEDGQESKAERQESRAYAYLADAADIAEGQQGQGTVAGVVTA